MKIEKLMRRKFLYLLGISLLTGMFLASCDSKGNRGNLKFDKIQLNETIHLFGDASKPGCNLTIDYTYAVKSSEEDLKELLNTYFSSLCFGDQYADYALEELIDTYAKAYGREYRTDLEPMYEEDRKNNEDQESVLSWYSYYRNIESHVQFYEKDLLVYRMDYNEYTGGAHGTYSSTFLNLDLKNRQKLSLNDVFTGDYQKELIKLLWEELMAEHKVGSRAALEDMGYGVTGDLYPTENFYLDKNGITFYYNIYEFTPYVMGATEISLPFDKVLHMIGSHPIIGQLRK